MTLQRDSISRLAVAFLERDPELLRKHGDNVLQIIEQQIKGYTLVVSCGEEINDSASYQAALLTAINVGKRCFKGGVYIDIPDHIRCLLPWSEAKSLKEVARSLGSKPKSELSIKSYTELTLGNSGNGWRLLVNNWSCGIIPPGCDPVELLGENNFPLGGIAGAALAVGSIFLRVTGFDFSIGLKSYGISLWRQDINWNEKDAQGPVPKFFPSDLWLLGLGHLGQAYSWVIGLLPFEDPKKLLLKLQDDDRLVKGNYDSGILSESLQEGWYKTRVVSNWLEARNIQTRIVERKYDVNYNRTDDDPAILLVGVDKLDVRKILKTDQFKLVLDCGLGAGLNFDMIRLNVFPNTDKTPAELWANAKEMETTPLLKELSQNAVGCGYTVGIASAFTGCFSASIMLAELLKSYHQGQKLSHHYLSLREIASSDYRILGTYGSDTFSGMTTFKY